MVVHYKEEKNDFSTSICYFTDILKVHNAMQNMAKTSGKNCTLDQMFTDFS